MKTTNTPLKDIPVHDAIEEWMAAALTGGLASEQDCRLFADHLAGCTRCRELFAEETAMNQTIQNAFDTVRPLPGFERRLAAAFRERRGAAFGERLRVVLGNLLRRPAVRALGAVAAVLALVAIGGLLTKETPLRQAPTLPVFHETMQALAIPAPDQPASAGNSEPGEFTGGGVADGLVSSAKEKAAASSISAFGQLRVAKSDLEHNVALDDTRHARRTLEIHRADADSSSFASNVSNSPAGSAGAATLSGSIATSRDLTPANTDFTVRIGDSKAKSVAGLVMADSAPLLGPPPAPAAAPVAAQPAASPEPSVPPDTRKLIRNASVELEVAAFDPAVDALGAAASQVGGGYVATVDSSRLANGKRRGTIVIKILPDRLDAFLARLHDLGEIKSQTVSAEDVTKAYYDTDARVRNARRMEDRLLKILDEDKGKLSEVLQVEKELGRVREDIEKMQGELQLYDALVRYATVTVTLYEKDLHQPAMFLLKQTADLSLRSPDVEKTYGDARHAAEDAHAQIENSELVRTAEGRVTANLRLLLVPDSADSVISRLKALARVDNFTLKGERVAENGDAASTAPGADDSRLKRAPVTLNLTIEHDEDTYRRVTLTLNAAEPSAAFDRARAAGLTAGGEIVTSNFDRTNGVHGSGVLVFRVPATRETGLLDTVRALGHTTDFNVQRQNDAPPDADAAPTLLTLNFGDEQVHHRASLTLIAPDLETAFDKTRAAALASGGEVTNSSFNRSEGGHGTATLSFLLPGKSEANVLAAVRALGRSSNFNVQRDASAPSDDLDESPVSLTVNFADEEPTVQQTRVGILCRDVDQRLAEVRKMATNAGAQARFSTFEQGTNGSEEAALVYRLPLRAYPDFISRVRTLGDVKELEVHRQDQPASANAAPAAADGSAPAEVSLRLYSQGNVVGDDSGIGATFRRTLGQGAGALMWSLRMIGVALAFLAPWVIGIILIVWLVRVVGRLRKG